MMRLITKSKYISLTSYFEFRRVCLFKLRIVFWLTKWQKYPTKTETNEKESKAIRIANPTLFLKRKLIKLYVKFSIYKA